MNYYNIKQKAQQQLFNMLKGIYKEKTFITKNVL